MDDSAHVGIDVGKLDAKVPGALQLGLHLQPPGCRVGALLDLQRAAREEALLIEQAAGWIAGGRPAPSGSSAIRW